MDAYSILVNSFVREHGMVAAEVLDDVELDPLCSFFEQTDPELLSRVVPFMNAVVTQKVFEQLNPAKAVEIIERLEISHAEFIVRRMSPLRSEEVLTKLSTEKEVSIRQLLMYNKETVGANMDPVVFTLPERATVADAITLMGKYKSDIDHEIYVLNKEKTLLGRIMLSDLLFRDAGVEISTLMKEDLITLAPETPLESILDHTAWMKNYSLPVVDQSWRFLGVIRLEKIRTTRITASSRAEKVGQNTIHALGDLYQIGLAGLLRGAADFDVRSSNE